MSEASIVNSPMGLCTDLNTHFTEILFSIRKSYIASCQARKDNVSIVVYDGETNR